MHIKTDIGDFATYEALYWGMVETGKRVVNCDIEYKGSKFIIHDVSIKAAEILKDKEYENRGLTDIQIKEIAGYEMVKP